MKGSHSIEVDLTFPISYFLPGLRCYEEVTLLSGLDLFLPMIFFYVQKKMLSTSYLYFLYTIGVPDFTWDFGSSRMASDQYVLKSGLQLSMRSVYGGRLKSFNRYVYYFRIDELLFAIYVINLRELYSNLYVFKGVAWIQY